MSSGFSASNTMDITPKSLNSDDQEDLIAESTRLKNENAELRRIMGLMQENVELRYVLKDHEKSVQTRIQKKDHKDRKQPHGSNYEYIKESKQKMDSYPPVDPKKVMKCQRIVGEMAFQLDRWILCAIFLEQHRLYGYRVPYIKEKILQVTTCPLTGKVDENSRSDLYRRFNQTMSHLKKLGYCPEVHGHVTEYLVNTYGIIKDKQAGIDDLSSFNDPEYLSKMVLECMPCDKTSDILIIHKCLACFAKEDGKSLFTC
ncbi:speriolin-like protein [Anomaloglossus baeobatrachus]|uniref:speriolin-like protein n=1 Tax=Anomaloglossus baeobatrachus TaxID=238106 RepID=UPI003F4FE6EB